MSWVSFPEGTREVVARGESLGYREWLSPGALEGDGRDTKTLVLVHGWMMTSCVWAPLLRRWGESPTAFRAIVVDLRGVGLSADLAPPITLDRLASDVAALLDTLDLREVSLVGHSMGGQVAALAASQCTARVSRLTLVCPVPPEGLPLPAEVATSFRNAGGNEAALGGILDAACKRLDAQARAALVDVASTITPDVLAAGFDAWTGGGIEAAVTGIQAATTVIATDDPFLPPALLDASWVRRITGSRLVKHDGAGHYPQIEDADDFATKLRAHVL